MAKEKYKTRITAHTIQGPIVAGNIQNVTQNFGSTEPGKTASSGSVENSTQNALSKKEKEEQEKFLSILHLSDIHLGNMAEADKYRVQLETDLKNELKINKLDFLVISGDIGIKSEPAEYQAAWNMVSTLMNHFDLDSNSVAVVPGNHDLNYDISEKAYTIYKRSKPENLSKDQYIPAGDGVLLPDNELYKERFENFSTEFFKKLYQKPYPKDYTGQGMLFISPENRILFLGFNSSWNIDHHFETRSGIHMQALTQAFDEVSKGNYDNWLKIIIFHHPVTGKKMMNDEFLQLLAVKGFQIAMHGDSHEAKEEFYKYDPDRLIHIIGAGTFGAPTKDLVVGIPHQYNLLKYYPLKNEIIVVTRKKEKLDGAWSADARWGDKNKPEPQYPILLKPTTLKPDNISFPQKPPKPERLPPLKVPDEHKKRIADCCRYMDIDKLREKGRVIQVQLPEIFIPLYTTTPSWIQKDEKQIGLSENEVFESRALNKESRYDIENFMMDEDYLLIEGEAGSGKTTLMKHFCYRVISEPFKNEEHEFLPALIFLKDIKETDLPKGIDGAQALLSANLPGMDTKTLQNFFDSGSLIILLDGLDEISPPLRDRVVQSFADFRNRYQGCKIILSGRPHGISGLVVDRFGDRHVRIQPLDKSQIEEFITRWFRYVYDEESKIGEKTAKDLISDIKFHDNIDRLTDNPLMLSAICILYQDGKELPGQRAELYKKFVTNLLCRRFTDPENVRYFLMALALAMHLKRVRGMGRKEAVAILRMVYLKKEEESAIQYNQRLDTIFDSIEPDSGLLKIEKGEYNFRHLTFQEFFAATGLVDKETDYSQAIELFWDDEWHREVIELYIGYLSIENRQWANKIVKEILAQKNKKPFYRWRLASTALLDIHLNTRDPEVVVLARTRLLSIFESQVDPKSRAEAGEILGRLGDPRNLEEFIEVEGGEYNLSTGKIKIKPFEMSKYPVTNQWYAKFIKDKGYENLEFWGGEGRKWLKETGAKIPEYWYDRQWNCPNAPVVGVSWYEAEAFALWLTKTKNDGNAYCLPDENQWEAAAGGFKKREYPWGSDFRKNNCNTTETGINKTSSVGIFKTGDTPEGISDFSGNVWEWTFSPYSVSHVLKTLRGGSWYFPSGGCFVAIRLRGVPSERFNYFGFRLILLPAQ